MKLTEGKSLHCKKKENNLKPILKPPCLKDSCCQFGVKENIVVNENDEKIGNIESISSEKNFLTVKLNIFDKKTINAIKGKVGER